MKRFSIALSFVTLGLWQVELIKNVLGNPVPIGPIESPFIRIPMLIAMFFIGSRVEYAYFKSKFFNQNRFGDIFKSENKRYGLFLRINLVTFPLTQILAYFFYIYFLLFFWFYIFLIEIGVVFIESHLLRIEFRKIVEVELPSRFILRSTLIANIFSFLVGLVAFFPIIL